jgi:hypothetical protein
MLKTIVSLGLCAGLLALCSCSARKVKEPGGTAEDSYLALNDPDEYAWRLFFFLNRQAEPGVAGVADPTKEFGELDREAPVVWETWALASGGNQSEVLRPGGLKPVEWNKLDRSAKRRHLILSPNIQLQMLEEEKSRALSEKHKKNGVGKRSEETNAKIIAFPPDVSHKEEQEVRINRSAFYAIREQGMYSADGLRTLLDIARQTNDRTLIAKRVRSASKEIKAEWLQIDDSQKDRYLWRESSGKVYGLVALHIITKDLPTWFWADFGHVDCETGTPPCSYKKDEGIDPKDSTTRGPRATRGSNGVRKETAKSVWRYYILRGTQTGFTKPDGEPQQLSNPVIENPIQNTSCITCHAYAAIGTSKSGKTGLYRPDSNYNLGVPDLCAFNGDKKKSEPEIKFLQTDFMWVPAATLPTLPASEQSCP